MLRYSICRCVNLSMSKPKKRNRNIQSLSPDHFKFSNLLPSGKKADEESSTYREDVFGELVVKKYSPPYYESNDFAEDQNSRHFCKSKWKSKSSTGTASFDDIETESITSGLSEIQLIRSLSSSPSWSEDNDTEASRRVQDELDHMDRVLRGIDPIPLHYDMDEYKQWMETFPDLSLFGKKEYGPYKIWKTEVGGNSVNIGCRKDEISLRRYGSSRTNLRKYKEEIKKAVIHNIYENISIRLSNGSQYSTSGNKLKNLNPVDDINKTQLYLSDCLKNSPFTRVIRDRYKKNCFVSRNNSHEEIEESPRFESLPLMLEDRNRNLEPVFSKYKNGSTLSTRNSRRSIVLPPIESDRINSANQFRSISATPIYSSLLSAKGMKLESKLLSGKSRNIPQF
ncbi:hypothetical protein HHI36_016284 [Cryptolaemus montrouzieri]|uniref:Uncharacterized protein n=1 Tax=Cryptolaemus montrouzieri TaxID=559131 RepID=A0ABD2NK10_9CUCU